MPKIFFGNLGIGHFIGYWELEIGYWELSPEGGNPQAFRHPDKMGGEGVEPSSLSAYGSEPYVFANFTTRPAHFIGMQYYSIIIYFFHTLFCLINQFSIEAKRSLGIIIF